MIPSLTKFTRYPKILLYGLPGLGKSTLASEMPSPVFIATTDGLEGLSVQAFPVAKCAQDVRDAIQYLLTQEHKFKTVVLDTLGWLEKLVHDEVCGELNLDFMTQSSMKSYPLASLKLRTILDSLNELNKGRKMMVCMIGHATITKFEDPTTASYDHYCMQMNEKVAEMFMQDADIVAFMNQRVTVEEEKGGFNKVQKAKGAMRWLFFDPCPAYYAKDHGYGLPHQMIFEEGKGWSAMWEIMKVKFITPKKEEYPHKEMKIEVKNDQKIDLSSAAEAQRERRAKREADKPKIDDTDNVPDSFINAPKYFYDISKVEKGKINAAVIMLKQAGAITADESLMIWKSVEPVKNFERYLMQG